MNQAESARADSREPARVSVRILEKEYAMVCPYEERSALLDSAEFLNARMREIRDSGKVSGTDRIAVMAALNIAHDLLRARKSSAPVRGDGVDADVARRRIQAMQTAIDQTMAGQEKLF